MRIAVVGTGYVGLVTGTCFADSGNTVTCIDIDAAKVARLDRGEIPIYEPGLADLVERNVRAGRLAFTTDTAAAVRNADIVFLAVGTPPAADGSADLTALWKVVDGIAAHVREDAIVVTKSTVPVGTCAGIERRLKAALGRDCRVASNPEFLKEGAAIEDFQKPDRVVVGARVSSACYISEAFPASLWLAWKYAGDFLGGAVANVLVGGDNCNRGAVVGGLLAASSPLPGGLVNGLVCRATVMDVFDAEA